MLKIRALNRELSSDEDVPVIRREAQEEIALELYNKALRLQADGEYCGSEKIILQLLDENIPLLENNGGLPKSMRTLKYSCHVNIGNIYLKQNRVDEALERYLVASELDATDVTLWYKIGRLSLKEDKFRQSAYAFSKGLECSESHWPCLDQLISILFAIQNTVACLVYIGKALILDSNYTKGLVLRRQIYRDNPATKEYYQLYNPDHIWEPPLEVEISEDDERIFIEEVQTLCDRVTEVEKSFAPKPLQVIPLSKPLEEYTWLSLTKTIVHLHQYIVDNQMSHFTMIDMNECMSGPTESSSKGEVPVESSNFKVNEEITSREESSVVNTSQGVTEPESQKPVEVEPLLERRFSQTSEVNMDGQENTPIQTDNDEEPNMDQDTEEQFENNESKSEKHRARGSKRKRDLLSDLQTWGWYSKRKQSKKGKDKDFTVEDALNRIISKDLLPNKIHPPDKYIEMEDSMNTIDIYNLYMAENVNYLSPIHSPKSVNYEQYFDTDREKEDVLEFWKKKREYCDAVVLIKDLVFSLSKLWHYKWPKELVPLYIEAYNMFREHCDPPQVFCGGHTFEEIRHDALATILQGELLSFSSEGTKCIQATLLGYLQLIYGWHDDWKDEYPSFFIRVLWLRSHIFRKENCNDLAIRALELIQEVVTEEESKGKERYLLSLPNCFKHGLVSTQIIQKMLKHLDLINSLGTVENLYNSEKYSEVAEILKQTFGSRNHPQVGRMGRPAQIGLLLHSLWFTDLRECFIWTEECLCEALAHFLKPKRDLDKWEKIMEKCLALLYEIIKKENISVIDALSEDNKSRLIESLAKIVSKQLNTAPGYTTKIPLGCITPWILLHYALSSDKYSKSEWTMVCLASPQATFISTMPESIMNSESDSTVIYLYTSRFRRIVDIFVYERSPVPMTMMMVRDEQRQYASKRISQDRREIDTSSSESCEIELHPSIAILFLCSRFLGPRGWCLTADGELLHFILDTVLDRLDTPVFEHLREKIDIHIEQSFFCLYQHPSKKNKISRHLADHNVDPLQLTWERAIQLFQFYGPDCLPEFNSYKNASISADLEQLLKRIIALVPHQCAPQHEHLPKVMDYIHGKIDKCPDPIDFPNKVRSIYYLIGDFYFKQREFGKCIKYFQLDLCINPQRLDSWACLGLSYAAQLDIKLNHCEKFKSETEFLDRAKYASRCFKNALDISPDPLMLWIECGTFQYTVHSYCSRILKYESENLSMEKFEFLENQKNSYLDSSGHSFEQAILLYEAEETNEPDERWLQYYILGKIAEKKQKEPTEYLQYYMTASTLLDENNAQYPEKILYNNPQHLAVEALELHYRIFASILKYLELHEGKDISNTLGVFFKKCLDFSKFSKKPPVVPKEVAAVEPLKPAVEPLNVAVETIAGVQIEPPPKPAEPTSLGFQEQFLNSLHKLGGDEVICNIKSEILSQEVSLNEDLTQQTDLFKNSSETKITNADSDEIIVNNNGNISEKTDNSKNVASPNIVKPINNNCEKVDAFKEPSSTKIAEDVIMISDSDDEREKIDKSETKPDSPTAAEIIKDVVILDLESPTDTKSEKEEVKDVQKMLDEMMVQTMKETEQQQNELDSDLSGTEKVEEVVVLEKDCDLKTDKEYQVIDDNTWKNEEQEKKMAVVKPSDSETDTDNKKTSAEDSTSSSSSSSSSSETSDSDSEDDSSSSTSSSSSKNCNENMSNNEILQLVEKCQTGLEICVTRLTQNYKALYRLAHLYFNYKSKNNLTKCKQLLLSEYKCKDGTIVAGLFTDRKANNFFNGIWRIPSTEIDRPGSLSAHMNRCISLLLQILRTTNDNKILIDLCLQLRKAPEPDKIYIKDSDRMAFSEQALTMCTQSLRSQMKDISTMTTPQIAKVLQEIFKIYQRIQKHVPTKENAFSSMLVEVYKKFIREKIPENINILDLAINFCSQTRTYSDKQKIQHPTIAPAPAPLSAPMMPHVPGIVGPPALPAPSSVASFPQIPLKRPGAGRPRGRPPGPKIPGLGRPQPKISTSSGLSKQYAWQKSLLDQTYAYEYLKHYQDELIKQYSQNLSIAQLSQLSQLSTHATMSNPLSGSSLPKQYLPQAAGFMNTSKLMGPTATTVTASAACSTTAKLTAATQILDSFNQMQHSNVKKKMTGNQVTASSISGGKTLQEKLADKKKEQLRKNIAAEAECSETSSKAFNIPSSVTISRSMVPVTLSPRTSPITGQNMNMMSQFSTQVDGSGGRPLPSITNILTPSYELLPKDTILSKAPGILTPSLPMPKMSSKDSGMSISKVPNVKQNQKSKESSNPSSNKSSLSKKHSLESSVEILPVKSKTKIVTSSKQFKKNDQSKNVVKAKETQMLSKRIETVKKDDNPKKTQATVLEEKKLLDDTNDIICID